MRRRTLYIGDKLKVLVNRPCCADLLKDDIVKVVRFESDGSPIVSNVINRMSYNTDVTEWYCVLTAFFRHYKKLKGGK